MTAGMVMLLYRKRPDLLVKMRVIKPTGGVSPCLTANGKLKIILLHIILLPTLLFVFYFFTLAPRPWTGVDEAVVEKIAREHGREAQRAAHRSRRRGPAALRLPPGGRRRRLCGGYYWRKLVSEKKDTN